MLKKSSTLKFLVMMGLSTALLGYVNEEARVAELEHQMSQLRVRTAEDTYSPKTATARPEVDGQGWFITFGILYWQARVGGTEYAYTDIGSPTPSNAGAGVGNALPISGRTKDMSFDWDWGLRIGLGYNFQHDNWILNGEYTWFDTNGSDSTRKNQNDSVIPLRGSSRITFDPALRTPFFIFALSAKSQFNFSYDAIDLELGRAYFISGKLSFRPHYGVKAAWFDLEQIVRYTGGSPGTVPGANVPEIVGLNGNTVHIEDTCHFWGVGPRVGFNTKWYLGNGFTFFGNLAGALLYGYFDVEHEERYSAYINNSIDLDANRHAFSPTAQMQLGLHYDTYVYNGKQHIGIGLGFEAQYWWRQNQMLKVDDSFNTQYERYAEDLSMHGVTFDLKWDF